ncbi:hypothetical protein [Nostoc sp. MS1]|uniref:hypothetical protein n=1 Tax=Nostoc sp. MS1 TaxID=2764711 RepID=UPI001CC78293|nr:hypothetical protein [Nostoc sp. MS1]
MAQYHALEFRTLDCRKLDGVRDWICAREEVHNERALIVQYLSQFTRVQRL